MFILIPLAIFIASLAAISYLALKKSNQAKELALADSDGAIRGFITDLMPEVFNYFQRINVAAHKSTLLLEFEKFLRRMRIMLLRVDNLSSKLMHKVRETHINETQKAEEKAQQIEEAKADAEAVEYINSITNTESTAVAATELQLKEKEIILAISQDPKNKALYKNLGDVYLEMQQWRDARESFNSALQLDPNIRGVKNKLKLANKMLDPQNS